MPPLDEQNEDMASSNMSDLDETASASLETAKPDDAASSPATGENEVENDLLSVVRDVVKESRNPETVSPAEGEEEQGQEQAAKKTDDEEYTDVPFNKHPRFQQLLRKAKTYQEDATRYHNVVSYLDDVGLSDEEAADGLRLMGLAKSNPAQAFEEMRPWLEQLVVAAGAVLPPDLQTRVQNGELTAAAAQEIAKAKAQAASLQHQQSFREKQEQSRQEKAFAQSITGAAESWEADRMAKDPNFEAKRPAIMKEIMYLHATEGKPTTPQGVRAQLKKAYDTINASLPAAPRAPAPRPVRPVTGGQVAGNQRPAPNGKEVSTLDIIRANRRSG
jgi:hypothetical protein